MPIPLAFSHSYLVHSLSAASSAPAASSAHTSSASSGFTYVPRHDRGLITEPQSKHRSLSLQDTVTIINNTAFLSNIAITLSQGQQWSSEAHIAITNFGEDIEDQLKIPLTKLAKAVESIKAANIAAGTPIDVNDNAATLRSTPVKEFVIPSTRATGSDDNTIATSDPTPSAMRITCMKIMFYHINPLHGEACPASSHGQCPLDLEYLLCKTLH